MSSLDAFSRLYPGIFSQERQPDEKKGIEGKVLRANRRCEWPPKFCDCAPIKRAAQQPPCMCATRRISSPCPFPPACYSCGQCPGGRSAGQGQYASHSGSGESTCLDVCKNDPSLLAWYVSIVREENFSLIRASAASFQVPLSIRCRNVVARLPPSFEGCALSLKQLATYSLGADLQILRPANRSVWQQITNDWREKARVRTVRAVVRPLTWCRKRSQWGRSTALAAPPCIGGLLYRAGRAIGFELPPFGNAAEFCALFERVEAAG
jgi:hypothetical protein